MRQRFIFKQNIIIHNGSDGSHEQALFKLLFNNSFLAVHFYELQTFIMNTIFFIFTVAIGCNNIIII